MRRRPLLIAAGVIVFVAVSFLLARYLTTENRERDAIYALLVDQAHGDTAAMRARLPGCSGRCAATVEVNARRLRTAGAPKILRLDSKTAYALGSASGPTRVAWTIINRQLPVVQCVDVQRAGSVLAGRRLVLHSISAPIGGEDAC